MIAERDGAAKDRLLRLVVAAVEYRAQMASGIAKAESRASLLREDREALGALREAAMAIAPGDAEGLHRRLFGAERGGGGMTVEPHRSSKDG